MRVLIYLVCYNAEKHIKSVLTRIPDIYRKSPNIKILISDDCSYDKTTDIALAACRELGYLNYEVMRTKANQGYGGNQKIGYNYACKNSYDYVVLLHGDGQYAPEELPNFFKIFESAPDVVLGSRMIVKKNALKGGMPAIKFISNIVLTKVQNMLAKSNFSEFHTGYRAYSVKFLKDIPFELNSNGFDFDTDILLQANFLERKIVELPIPTYYGDEKCHVNVLEYAINILKTTVRFRLQQFGIGCSLKFRGSKQAVYKNKFCYKFTSHYYLLQAIRQYNPKRILELGSGPGYLAQTLHDDTIHVTGIDISHPKNNNYKEFFCDDIELFDWSRINNKPFDMVCLMDIMEHLKEPELLLLRLRSCPFSEQAVFVFSVPNIAFFSIRLCLLFGRFNYADRGILDIDHKRLFTFRSIDRLIKECGYNVVKTISVPPPFQLFFSNKLFADFLSIFFLLLNKFWPGLFSFQIMKIAEPIPTSETVFEKMMDRYL